MNKYELALVVSANVEDEVRNATVEQVKELITRFGGTITDPGTCEKKKLAYEIQHMSEGYYNSLSLKLMQLHQQKLSQEFVLWRTLLDS